MKTDLFYNDRIELINDNGLEYIQFKTFKKHENIIKHCFTTRKGGVSTEECHSLNLGFNRNDTRVNVQENYIRLSKSLGIDINDMVFSNQVHNIKIKEVDESDRGKGIVRKSDILGYDGLITDKNKVVLVTFYADCVPVFFFDPEKKVIGLAHSGWRGTVKEIAVEMILKMKHVYKSNFEDIEIGIGPSIGNCCFEVDYDVYKEFNSKFNWIDDYSVKTSDTKYHMDLQGIIKKSLIIQGVDKNKIETSGICTKCNKDTFFSHRGDCGKTGSLAAIMQLN